MTKILIDRAVVEQALEALEVLDRVVLSTLGQNAITALRAKLAEPVQEPVAVYQWRKQGCADWYDGHPDYSDCGGPYETRTLYTAPPQRPAEPVQEPDNGGKTGWPPGLLQDDCRGLSKWLASRPDARQRLREALAAPVQEPVAWRFEARHIDSAWGAAVSLKHPGPEGVYMRNVVPLYAAPPQRKPLTEGEIVRIFETPELAGTHFQTSTLKAIAVARAVEAAHGIKEEK